MGAAGFGSFVFSKSHSIIVAQLLQHRHYSCGGRLDFTAEQLTVLSVADNLFDNKSMFTINMAIWCPSYVNFGVPWYLW